MSGFPGRWAAWSRKRYPIPCNILRTKISGFESLPKILLMISDRFSLLKTSVN